MPSSRILIASNTLTSSAASVTFSSIPNIYTDLVLRISARSDRTTSDAFTIQFNSDTSTNYSITRLVGTGSASSSSRTTSDVYLSSGLIDWANATANTFSSNEVYIPSYLVSQNKPVGVFSVQEDNATAAGMHVTAGLWRNTAAITSIVLAPSIGPNFVSGSSFFLYGLKNS